MIVHAELTVCRTNRPQQWPHTSHPLTSAPHTGRPGEPLPNWAGVCRLAARAGGALPEQSPEERLNALHPGFERDLADAEAFFIGSGSLEDLHLFFC
ncbi:hypothetical protein ACH4NT_32230 [Streptomyces lydicus]|uniref:hypothetical protein n=1 Tax=Streptomyces lydicus TaxID=47763 RepID=UPI0037AF317A